MKGPAVEPMDPRIEELLAERALRPLDDKELSELQRLGAEDDDSFDHAAAALAVAGTVIEPMPPAVAARILAASPAGTGVVNYHRTLPGVVMPLPDRPRDTMVDVDLEEIRLASQPGADAPTTQPSLAQNPATATKAMPVVVAALPETLPPPKLGRRPAKPAPIIEPLVYPTIDPVGPTLPPTSDYPQDSQPYSIESPPISVPLPVSRQAHAAHATHATHDTHETHETHQRDELVQHRVAQRRQAAETVPLPRPRQRVILPWLLAAACLAVAGGAVWWSSKRIVAPVVAAPTVTPLPTPAAERTQLLANKDANPITIAWTATQDANAHGASGDVVWSASAQRGFMRFVGLAPNDARQYQYQLWIFDKARDQAFPVEGGVFDVSSTGEVIVAISPKLHVDDLAMFAVTIEKPGGVVVSKRERIVVTAAPS